MRKVVTGLMGLAIALTLAGSAVAGGWHHHGHHGYGHYAYYRPAPAVAFYAGPPRAYYPAPYPYPYVAPAPVVTVAPYVPFGIGYQSRRFSVFLGY